MHSTNHYHLLSAVFEYPDDQFVARARRARECIDGLYPQAVVLFDQFLALLPDGDLRVLQELFTRSFDVQAITTLDIGYVLFGDDYKRGELLANLNREHREAGNACGRELADHLPNLLRLLAKLDDDELIVDLVEEIIAPALRKMIGEFSPDRLHKRNESYKKHYKTVIDAPAKDSATVLLYQFALQSLYEILKQDFSLVEQIETESTSDFLGSVNKEIEIEEKAGAFY